MVAKQDCRKGTILAQSYPVLIKSGRKIEE